jgi:hypothetical protein
VRPKLTRNGEELECKISPTVLSSQTSLSWSTCRALLPTRFSVNLCQRLTRVQYGTVHCVSHIAENSLNIFPSAIHSKEEKFPIEPCPRSFQLVRHYLNSINYDGPVGLSCDDSKLFAAFRPYFNTAEDAYYVVGCTGSPLRIADIDDFNDQLCQGNLEKATKVSESIPPNWWICLFTWSYL